MGKIMEMNGRFEGGEVLERLDPEIYEELKGELDTPEQAAEKGEAPARKLPVPQRLVRVAATGDPQRKRMHDSVDAASQQPPLERTWVIVAMAAGAAAIAAATVIAIMP
jgi:hypothetical protein